MPRFKMLRLQVVDHFVNWSFLLTVVTPEHPGRFRTGRGFLLLFPCLGVFRPRMFLPIFEVIENKGPVAFGAFEESSLLRY